ncbi:CotH kinase family protein [Peredibacter sp. HCB2-198]|uniref:CotH kinase family protein n=1 Tax=Peredibacter sp. HCB2-198 TaxID=3383025 RepID=UPI0038B531EA
MRLKHFAVLFFALSLSAHAQEEEKDGKKKFPKEARMRAQELVKKYAKPGENVVVIVVPQEDMDKFFLEDATKREKIESKVLIVDDKSVFKGKISPGGQSTLKAATPNLRVKKLENVSGDLNTIAGVENISGTTRINPLTMDEGYAATSFYQRSLNKFGLVPKATEASHFQLSNQYAKVVYVPIDESGKLLENKKVSAGLHLVNNHPVKFLSEAQSDRYSVEAVARSRYNVENVTEKLGIKRPDPETEIFSSLNSNKKTSPHRVEMSWSADDAKKAELQRLITDIYAAPVNLSGEALFKELSKKMDLDQMFRFMAFNNIIRNGDISDEYFWFTQKDKKTGKTILRIMPQDGDDLLKGVHMFPFHPQQVGLIARDKLKMSKDFIINLEDPLFRAIKNDPYLYEKYLNSYKKMAKEISSSKFLDTEFKAIEKELSSYSKDADVLLRGATDEVGRVYDQDSFSKRIAAIKAAIQAEADEALKKIDLEIAKSKGPAEIQRVRAHKMNCFRANLSKLLSK